MGSQWDPQWYIVRVPVELDASLAVSTNAHLHRIFLFCRAHWESTQLKVLPVRGSQDAYV